MLIHPAARLMHQRFHKNEKRRYLQFSAADNVFFVIVFP